MRGNTGLGSVYTGIPSRTIVSQTVHPTRLPLNMLRSYAAAIVAEMGCHPASRFLISRRGRCNALVLDFSKFGRVRGRVSGRHTLAVMCEADMVRSETLWQLRTDLGGFLAKPEVNLWAKPFVFVSDLVTASFCLVHCINLRKEVVQGGS